jgi:hypothetical protein
MRKLIPIFLIFTLLACSSKNSEKGQQENIPVQKNTNENAEITTNEDIHDFGVLQAGEIVAFSFIITNSENSNLILKNIETDCGCITADFTKTPILPGQTGIVEVEFDSSGLIGKQFKTIEIYTNTKKTKQIAIFAEVQNEQIEYKY